MTAIPINSAKICSAWAYVLFRLLAMLWSVLRTIWCEQRSRQSNRRRNVVWCWTDAWLGASHRRSMHVLRCCASNASWRRHADGWLPFDKPNTKWRAVTPVHPTQSRRGTAVDTNHLPQGILSKQWWGIFVFNKTNRCTNFSKFGKISASVRFIKKKFVTMHVHMNMKMIRQYLQGLHRNFFLIEDIPFCFNSENKIKWFILSEHNNIYNHQHPSMATCFSPFLDHPQANIQCKRY